MIKILNLIVFCIIFNPIFSESKYYWENGISSPSKYYWEYETGPGSKYYWDYETGRSIITSYPFGLPICIAISKSIGVF